MPTAENLRPLYLPDPLPQTLGSCRGKVLAWGLAAALFGPLGAAADELAPLQRGNLVRVPEPLPEEGSLVVPPEPLPQKTVSPPLGSVLLLSAEEAEIMETVNRWLVAWWQQQVDDYLAFYAEDFQTPQELDRISWEEQRRQRLAAPAFIAIRIEPPEVIALGEDLYRARFIQHYRSDTYEDTVLKELDLTREGGRWKIRKEESRLPVLPDTQASL